MDMSYYFDNNATTRVSLSVSKAIAEAIYYDYGNASSSHSLGLRAKEKIRIARAQVATLFAAKADEIIFTSGATEANNAIIYSALKNSTNRRVILTSAVEHPSVANTLRHYETLGYRIIRIPVTERGIDLNCLKNNLNHDIALASFMAVNNETGTIFPIDEMFQYIKQYDNSIICHSDCVQAVGKTSIPYTMADYLTISAHKFHGPKGIGCIYRKREVPFYPILFGGGQEYGYRSGTENIPGIVGMGVAVEEIAQSSLEKNDYVRHLHHKLEQSLINEGAYIVGLQSNRVPGVTNVGFSDIEANQLVLLLSKKHIFVSTGSACSSNKIGISPVIREMGVPEAFASTIRISMSKYTTKEEVDYLIECITQIIRDAKVRQSKK